MRAHVELQAVVASGGRGARLPTFPGAPPKCLLPVGPYPLIWYPLNLLERQGFHDVIIIILDINKLEIVTAIEKLNLKLKIEYFTIPSDEDMGTADSLKLIHDHIFTDVLFISCDFITDINLNGLIDLYRKHDASLVSLFFDNGPQEFIQTPGPKTKEKPERDFVGIDKETQRLVFLASASDFDDELSLPKLLLNKHPDLSIQSRLLDSHVYILKKWIIDFVAKQKDKNFTTLKGELLPYIIKKQLSRPNVQTDQTNPSLSHVVINKDVFKYAVQNELDNKIRKLSSYNDHLGGIQGCYHDDIIRCYAYVPEKDSCYAIRVNTFSAYCLINNKIIQKWNDITKNSSLDRIHPTSDVKSKQVDEFTVIGEQSNIAEKTSIKHTIIGSHCTVENKVKLTNCIIMNNVVIKEGCTLQDCVIYSGVIIENDCILKLCVIGPKYTIPSKKCDNQQMFCEEDTMITLG